MVIASDRNPPSGINGVPKLALVAGVEKFDAGTVSIRYKVPNHANSPHIVKFSGGRTSGMLLFTLLENGLLDARRGDVVVFNNTSAEHPATYDFVRQCKEVVERDYGIPFFIIEFQTYEKRKGDGWRRAPTFRLANSRPYDREDNPDGYRWRGEVFEEMLSWRGYLPNIFQRACTQYMKVGATHDFLREWFWAGESTEYLGHEGAPSIDDDEWLRRYRKRGGKKPSHVFLNQKKFLEGCSPSRKVQRWGDYSDAWLRDNDLVFSDCVSFVGIRHDEPRRVARIHERNRVSFEKDRIPEHSYMPLNSLRVTAADVMEFWKRQEWDLRLRPEDNLSNCTFCFLKGAGKLARANHILKKTCGNRDDLRNTPADINWWVDIERKYGKKNADEGRRAGTCEENDFIGFFTLRSKLSYDVVKNDTRQDVGDIFDGTALPCDCTD